MAQEDAVSKAKGVLAGAKKFSAQADPSGINAKPAPAANAMPKAKSASMPAGSIDNGGPADNRAAINAEGAKVGMKGVPIMHDGGMVKKTGPAILEKGEKVVPKEKVMKNADLGKMAGAKKDMGAGKHESKGGSKKHKHTHIEHHDDGTHTVRHTPKGGGEEVSYSKPDLDGVIDGLHQNIGGGAPAAGGADMGGGSPDMAGGAAPAAAAPAGPAAGAPPAGM